MSSREESEMRTRQVEGGMILFGTETGSYRFARLLASEGVEHYLLVEEDGKMRHGVFLIGAKPWPYSSIGDLVQHGWRLIYPLAGGTWGWLELDTLVYRELEALGIWGSIGLGVVSGPQPTPTPTPTLPTQ